MVTAGVALLSLKTSNFCLTNSQMFSLSTKNQTVSRLINFGSFIDSQRLKDLVFYANHFLFDSSHQHLYHDYDVIKYFLVFNLELYCKNISLGYKKFLQNGELNRVTFFMPKVSYSERTQKFSLLFFHEVELFNGSSYFCITFLLPDGQLASTQDINNYINFVYGTNSISKEVFADNSYYSFKINGTNYSSGVTWNYREVDFLKLNLGIDFDASKAKAVITSIGQPSFYNQKTRINKTQIYTSLEENGALCCFHRQKWYNSFEEKDYWSYRRLSFQVLSTYDAILNLISAYRQLISKSDKTPVEILHQKTLSEILKNISKRHKIQFTRDIQNSISEKVNIRDILSNLGAFTGSFTAEFLKGNE